MSSAIMPQLKGLKEGCASHQSTFISPLAVTSASSRSFEAQDREAY
jgi:hypothetical protein